MELLVEEGFCWGYFGDFVSGEGYSGKSRVTEGWCEGGDLEARGEGLRGILGIGNLRVEREGRGERRESAHWRGREEGDCIVVGTGERERRRGVIWEWRGGDKLDTGGLGNRVDCGDNPPQLFWIKFHIFIQKKIFLTIHILTFFYFNSDNSQCLTF